VGIWDIQLSGWKGTLPDAVLAWSNILHTGKVLDWQWMCIPKGCQIRMELLIEDASAGRGGGTGYGHSKKGGSS